MLRPRTKLEWAFLATTTIQATIIIFIQVIILISYFRWINPVIYQVPLSYITPLSLSTTILGYLFQALLTPDALRIKNTIQLLAQCICNICLSLATGMQYSQIKDASERILDGYDLYMRPFAKTERAFWEDVGPSLGVCVGVAGGCSVVMGALVGGLYREFAWVVYQDVCSEQRMRSRYLAYQVYLVIMKFALFFLTAFILVYDILDVHFVEPEFSLTMAIIPAALIHAVLAVYCVRVETVVGMAFIMFIHMAEIVYLASRLVVLCGNGPLANTALKDEMLLFAGVGLCLAVFTFIAGCVCISNFNKGLKPILRGKGKRKAPANQERDMYYFQRLNHPVPPILDQDSRRFPLD
ncbi:Nn.00g017810.m01.CDS01 [Neocucurbitaria sp. VM-36]